MSGAPLGYVDDAGFAYSGGYGELIDSLLEYVPDLLWPLSVRTFSKMRMDPQLAAVLAAYTLPIRRAAWALDGSGCNPKVTDFLSAQLDLPILGQDSTPSGARRRGFRWAQHLRLSLLDLTFGFMPFERTFDTSSGTMATLGAVAERMPQTVGQIFINNDGTLEKISQNALAGAGTTTQPIIPAKNLVWYAHNREGAAWTGRSLLRSAYAPWLIKHELWRVHATSIRRFGMGVPSVEAPPGATPGQVLEAQRLASAMRGGDQAGAGLPNGFKIALNGITGSVPDALGFIQYLDHQMTRATLTSLLDLGDTAHGSRALGETFMDLFMLSLQTIADERAVDATDQLVVPLVDANWGEDEPAPRIVCGDVGAQHEVTAQTLQLLMTSKALSADPALEEWIRREYKLPARSTPWVDPVEAPVPAPPPAQARRKAPKAAAAAGGTLRRQPTEVEAAAKTDFQAVQDDWQSALDALVADWGKITAAQRQDLLDQVRAAVAGSDLAALADLNVDTKAAAQALQAAMEAAAAAAAELAASEAQAQGVDTPDATPDANRLSGVATTTASVLGAGLASFAARQAMQVWGPDSTPDDVAGAVGDAIDSLTDSTLRDGLGGALTAAQNEGRVALLNVAPQATYYASEILDSNTCEPCAAEDGQQFADLAEAQAAYATGGYSECLGGLRCRGIVVAVWDDSSATADDAQAA